MDVQLTAMQRRTVTSLLGDGSGAAFDPDLPERLRSYLEAGVAGMLADERVRLSKERLNDLDRCEGSFAAALAGERHPFAPTAKNAVGVLLHGALEADAATPTEEDPEALVAAACSALAADRRFGPFWSGLDAMAQAGIAADALAGVELFRASFPPLGPARRLLAPAAERWVGASLAGGRVTLSGRIDLMVGRSEPRRATRVLIDLKTGGAWPEHAEDMRLYALLFTLRFGVLPLRVASFFLRSGECQPEDVSEPMLVRSADRVIRAVRTAARIRDGAGGEPALRAGPHCDWCPRKGTCPAARMAFGLGAGAAGMSA
jgi:PD-(D/E)XK nuclease superfamily